MDKQMQYMLELLGTYGGLICRLDDLEPQVRDMIAPLHRDEGLVYLAPNQYPILRWANDE